MACQEAPLAATERADRHEAITIELLERAYAKAFRKEKDAHGNQRVNPFGPSWYGELPPPLGDHSLLLHPKQRRKELNDALTV